MKVFFFIYVVNIYVRVH